MVYISLHLLLLCLTILDATFLSACVHMLAHTYLSLYFYSVWLLGNSVYMAFPGWWPYKSFESQLVVWTFEMLTARKPSHFWKKGCHKYWTLLKKEPDANGKYKCYPKKFSFVYKKYFFVPNSYMWLDFFFFLCRCPLPRKWWLKC